MGWFRRVAAGVEVATVPVVTPRATIDGWTLEGTVLEGRIPRSAQRELCTMLHGVASGADTPYTYLRAVAMLGDVGEFEQADAVAAAWLDRPAAARAQHASETRSLTRQRARLRARLAARTTATPGSSA